MPVNHSNYDHRGGNNVRVIRCPTFVGDRLVYFDYNTTSRNWVIRDFILDLKLDNEHSPLLVADIEADAVRDEDEFPPWLNARLDAAEWKAYLRNRTNAVLKLRTSEPSTVRPNRQSDTWLPLP